MPRDPREAMGADQLADEEAEYEHPGGGATSPWDYLPGHPSAQANFDRHFGPYRMLGEVSAAIDGLGDDW